MKSLEEIIRSLDCFTAYTDMKCGDCPYNPHPGKEWQFGCVRGQAQLVKDAKEMLGTLRRPENPTNWDYIKAAIDDEIDDGGASREATIYYDIACPYYGNDPDAHCHGMHGQPDRDMCSACKEEWLGKKYEG